MASPRIVREALLKGGDEVDYPLSVDGKAIGIVKAKPEGFNARGRRGTIRELTL